MAINYNSHNISTSGSLTSTSGNFTQSLQVNGTGVSLDGHTHTSLRSIAPGSVGSPSIASSGDLSTGFYFPSSGSLVIASSGFDRFKIDYKGDIFFGGENIDSLRYLDINNINPGSNAGSILRLITTDVSGTTNTSAHLVKYKTGQFGINNNETDPAAFTTFNVGNSERLRITSSGNVGIGTAVPTSKLDVVGGISATSGNFTTNLQVGSTSLTSNDVLNIINSNNLYLWSNFR